jgi:hypothetical protein
MVCKTKGAENYTVRLEVIDAYERIQLMNMLVNLKNSEE